ncbi:MAG: DNA recombination protein RmuC [Gammaproteobacteria bacterium]
MRAGQLLPMIQWGQLLRWELIVLAFSLFLLGLGIGAYIARYRADKLIARAREQSTQLETQLEIEQQRHQEKLAAIEDSRKQTLSTFALLSNRALKENTERFLQLARENLKGFQVQAEAGLEKKEKAIETLVKPIRDALDKTEQQIRTIEKERTRAYGELTQHLKQVAESQSSLQNETRNLTQALRRPEVRGQWGELTLKRLVELAGMVDRCDFVEQPTTQTDEGRSRPDMIIRMPENREIIVDAKTPLDAYLSAMEAQDDDQRQNYLDAHARNVHKRIRELSAKAYWSQFKNSPEYVVLFIPGEQFLSSALDVRPDLQELALQAKVIPATPNNFIALLKTVAFGWRQLAVAENAEKIRDIGEDLYKRVATFVEHMSRMGRSLDASVDHYNKAVGSLERQLLPGARRFTELGIQSKKALEELDFLEKTARLPAEKE